VAEEAEDGEVLDVEIEVDAAGDVEDVVGVRIGVGSGIKNQSLLQRQRLLLRVPAPTPPLR
jgi:hypothetical protein